MLEKCLFCDFDKFDIVAENELSYAIRDIHPVTPLHTLIISKAHYETMFDLPPENLVSLLDLAKVCRAGIMDEDPSVAGFNFGANSGNVAGQKIGHVHFHLIPRRAGDVVPPAAGL